MTPKQRWEFGAAAALLLVLLAIGVATGGAWLRARRLAPQFERALGKDVPHDVDAGPVVDLPRVEALVAQGADVNARGDQAITPLIVAVRARNLRLVQELLGRGARVNAADQAGHTPIQEACGFLTPPDLEIVRTLLAAGANPNVHYRLSTPLGNAAGWGSVPAVKLLLNAGAGGSVKDLTAALLAAATATSYAEDALRSGRPRVDADQRRAVMKLLLARGADVNGSNQAGYTVLQETVRAGQVDAVRVLLAHGADPNRSSRPEETPIRLARDRGALLPGRVRAIVRLLRRAGAKQ